jgi:hypothetical protein
MITLDEARDIANEYVSKLESEAGKSLRIVDEQTIEKSFGWVFFYNSKDYLETGDFRSMLVGNAPLIVDKNDGSLHETGTAKPVSDYISDYEEKY